ncbi:MAG: spore coat protein [Acutalibacteraceae bacterium]
MISNETAVKQNMDDQEILNDVLFSQKQITGNYNTSGNECVDEKLKADMLNILRDEHNMQSDVFTQMLQRGWYQTPPAQQQKIDAARTKFQNISAQLA